MTHEGTVVNGVIVPDGPPPPEGERVRYFVAATDEDDLDLPADESITYPHPMAPYNRETELALLRERVAEAKAGAPGVPLTEAMARIAANLNLPVSAPE